MGPFQRPKMGIDTASQWLEATPYLRLGGARAGPSLSR